MILINCAALACLALMLSSQKETNEQWTLSEICQNFGSDSE